MFNGIFLAEGLIHLILYFGVLAFASSEPWSVAVLQILISLLFSVTWATGSLSFGGPVQKWLVPGILALVFIGTLQLTDPRPIFDPNSGPLFTTSAWATRKAILLWLSYAALLVCAASLLDDPARFRRLAWSIFLLGVIVAMVGLGFRSERTPLLLGFRTLTKGGSTTHFGPFVNRDHAASFLAMCGMVGWGLFFSQIALIRKARRRGQSIDRVAIASLILSMIAALFFCLVRTGSRGGTHSFFAASLIVGFLASTRFTSGLKRVGLYAGLLGLFGVLSYILYHNPHWRGYVDGRWLETLQWRVTAYEGGLRMLSDFPVFGTGLGAFSFGFPPYQDARIAGFVRHIHSDWLQLALETGLSGFLAFTASLLALLVVGSRRWLCCRSGEIRSISGGVLGGLLAVIFHMCLDFPFQMGGNAVTFFLLAALLGSGITLERAREAHDLPAVRPGSLAVKFLSAAVPAAVALFSIPTVVAEFQYHRSSKAPIQIRPYYLTSALHWDENPWYAVQLARAYRALAWNTPNARLALTRAGLGSVEPYYRLYPVHRDLRRIHEALVYDANPRLDLYLPHKAGTNGRGT